MPKNHPENDAYWPAEYKRREEERKWRKENPELAKKKDENDEEKRRKEQEENAAYRLKLNLKEQEKEKEKMERLKAAKLILDKENPMWPYRKVNRFSRAFRTVTRVFTRPETLTCCRSDMWLNLNDYNVVDKINEGYVPFVSFTSESYYSELPTDLKRSFLPDGTEVSSRLTQKKVLQWIPFEDIETKKLVMYKNRFSPRYYYTSSFGNEVYIDEDTVFTVKDFIKQREDFEIELMRSERRSVEEDRKREQWIAEMEAEQDRKIKSGELVWGRIKYQAPGEEEYMHYGPPRYYTKVSYDWITPEEAKRFEESLQENAKKDKYYYDESSKTPPAPYNKNPNYVYKFYKLPNTAAPIDKGGSMNLHRGRSRRKIRYNKKLIRARKLKTRRL